MTKAQVRYLLGSPDINDPWNANKWYYLYANHQQGLPPVSNRLILTFSNNKLAHVTGNYPPPAALRYKTYKAPK